MRRRDRTHQNARGAVPVDELVDDLERLEVPPRALDDARHAAARAW
jgi:hypothetical protein